MTSHNSTYWLYAIAFNCRFSEILYKLKGLWWTRWHSAIIRLAARNCFIYFIRTNVFPSVFHLKSWVVVDNLSITSLSAIIILFFYIQNLWRLIWTWRSRLKCPFTWVDFIAINARYQSDILLNSYAHVYERADGLNFPLFYISRTASSNHFKLGGHLGYAETITFHKKTNFK